MKEPDKRPNEKLKRERELRGWSQRTIAARVGTAEQVVARWEGGRHKPNRYFQTQLCELFGKNAEELGFLIPASDNLACEVSTQEAIKEVTPVASTTIAEGFNASRLAGYGGACFVRLHQPDRALPALQRALSLLDPQAIRRQSTPLTDIGIAYAQQGNILKACQLADQALSLTKQTKSRVVLEHVRTLHSE
jgi:transcriptional regulator with XRE-family HTH domain